MKIKKTVTGILCLLVVVAVAAWILIVSPVIHEKQSKSRVFADMQSRLDEVSDSVIGILPRTQGADGSVNYGGGGSGVVFDRDGDVYYVLTAAHVVSDTNAAYKAYTAKTEVNTIDISGLDGLDFEIVDEGFYENLADVTVEYISPKADLAVVSFRTSDELTVAALAETVPVKGDRVVCLGHPDGKGLQTISYGTINSGLKTITARDKGTGRAATDSVLSHDAYLNHGSSGGPAFLEDMTIGGINSSGSFGLFGHFRAGFMIPVDQLKDCIAQWKANTPRPVPAYADLGNWAYYGIGEGKAADLFLICPTVDVKDEYNMSLDDEDAKASFLGALNMERGIYEDSTRMFAPYYRQAAMQVYGLGAEEREPYLSLAYSDVSESFAFYLAHENNGRPIVLAGFSQGADMCYRLLAEYFGDADLYDQLVAVYAIGWPCTAELTEQYPQIRPAETSDDIGVVVSFDCESPEVTETFINPAGVKGDAINPLNWKTDGTVADRSENLGACFTDYSGAIRSEQMGLCGCYLDEERGVLKVTDVDAADYPAIVPGLPEGAFHIYDYQFFFRNLQQNVADRLEAYCAASAADQAA